MTRTPGVFVTLFVTASTNAFSRLVRVRVRVRVR